PRQKARVRHGGIDEPGLLKARTDEEREATRDADLDEAARPGVRDASRLDQGERRQADGRNEATRGNEQERADMLHGRLLKIECNTPDGGGEKQQEIGSEAAHEGEVIVGR